MVEVGEVGEIGEIGEIGEVEEGSGSRIAGVGLPGVEVGLGWVYVAARVLLRGVWVGSGVFGFLQ